MPLNVSLGWSPPEFGDVAVDESQVSPLSLGKMRLSLSGLRQWPRFGRTLCRIDQRTLGILPESLENVRGTVASCSFDQRMNDAVHLRLGEAKSDPMRQ